MARPLTPTVAHDELSGYWPSPWPAEDGGPLRRQASRSATVGFDLTGGATLRATSRALFATTMCVLRDPGEVFVLCHSVGPAAVSWVERIHPESLEPLARSVDLAGGPFWPGGIAVHADGSLYVTFGRWCHRLDPETLAVMAARELPRDRAYNSLVVLGDGRMAMKDIGGGSGRNRLPDGVTGSELVVLEPGSLEVTGTLELPEGSIARLSASGNHVIVVGERRCHRVTVAPDGALVADPAWQPEYRTIDGQTNGWDIVLADGSGWFLDNGEGSEEFAGSFRGGGRSAAPLHLVRVPLPPGDGQPASERPVELAEVCGEIGGVIANPPTVDPDRHIAVGYDSGHGVMTAWRYEPGAAGLEQIWQRRQHHAGHMLRFPDSGQLMSYDYDHDRGLDQVVLLDIASGDELARTDTGSPVQCVLFPAAGWSEDAYVCTFAAVTRVFCG